jgi:5-(carboxyamino)imidazole ribonucleotide synthase
MPVALQSPLKPGDSIGIIGGGQLGRMLAMAAARLGYRTIILEPDERCPAEQVASSHITAAYDDPEALDTLAALCSVVTYEFENVPIEAVRMLEQKKPVFPPPRALEVAQDRLTEKTFLNECGIATAEFSAVDSQQQLQEALDKFGGRGVLKTRRLGYDGKGQRVFSGPQDDPAGAFGSLGHVPLILEKLIPFTSEISIIAARSKDGATVSYDPAKNEHREGILRQSTVPSSANSQTENSARQAAEAVLRSLDYIGVIGIEFFVMEDGSLLANELAPRVHNSGHWTEAACHMSQFEQHIRAVSGLALGPCDRHFDCRMDNLIGDEIEAIDAILTEPNAVLHLYGKSEVRPGRKMGHVTRLGKPV